MNQFVEDSLMSLVFDRRPAPVEPFEVSAKPSALATINRMLAEAVETIDATAARPSLAQVKAFDAQLRKLTKAAIRLDRGPSAIDAYAGRSGHWMGYR